MWDPLLERIRERALHESRAPKGSPEQEVRRHGDRLFVRGVLLMPVSLFVMYMLVRFLPKLAWVDPVFAQMQTAIELSMPFVFATVAALAIGGYRSLIGKDPDAEGESPAKRIGLGVAVGCGVLVVVLPLFGIFIALIR